MKSLSRGTPLLLMAFPTHCSFFVRRSGVDQAVTGLESVGHTSFTLPRVRDLKNTETQDGHLHTVVESDVLHIEYLCFRCVFSENLLERGTTCKVVDRAFGLQCC